MNEQGSILNMTVQQVSSILIVLVILFGSYAVAY